MVSKAEAARRRAGREKKVAPSMQPAETSNKPSTPNKTASSSHPQPTTTTSATSDSTSTMATTKPRSEYNQFHEEITTGTYNKYAVPREVKKDGGIRYIEATSVEVYFRPIWTPGDCGILGVEEIIDVVETKKLYALSHTFSNAIFDLPITMTRTGIKYKWVLDETICSKKALIEVLKWLKRINNIPIPDNFRSTTGSVQLYPPDHWDVRAWAAMFKLTQWLHYKAPFDNQVLFARCRDHILDDSEYDSMVVIDIWKGCRTERQQKTRRGILDRMVAYVEWLDDIESSDELDAFYRPAHHAWMEDMERFCPGMAVAFVERENELAAYRTRMDERAERDAKRAERVTAKGGNRAGGRTSSEQSSDAKSASDKASAGEVMMSGEGLAAPMATHGLEHEVHIGEEKKKTQGGIKSEAKATEVKSRANGAPKPRKAHRKKTNAPATQ